ncbi:MAG TPA: VWA domain-containing protein [Bryobacteraceae bacterium]|nr:VWA domain-containing protein [Bryobacteraceae bacterium]
MAAIFLSAQETTIRVDVRLVRLLATVKDNFGNPIGNLKKEEFTVLDNGVPQEIAVFERHTEQPLSVALLVDTSASTAKDFRYQAESVTRFLRALFREGNPKDAVSLYSFNWQVLEHSDFTRNAERLERAVRGMKSEAGTAMYDAIWLAADNLEQRDGRHVMVIVTDGADTVSTKKYRDAVEALHRADSVLYAILVIPITNDAGRNIGGENALTTMTASTGGRMFMPSLGASLNEAFDEILRDLRTQYLIGYYPRNIRPTKDPFHRTDVRVARSGLRVVTRSGYYGDFTDAERPSAEQRGARGTR